MARLFCQTFLCQKLASGPFFLFRSRLDCGWLILVFPASLSAWLLNGGWNYLKLSWKSTTYVARFRLFPSSRPGWRTQNGRRHTASIRSQARLRRAFIRQPSASRIPRSVFRIHNSQFTIHTFPRFPLSKNRRISAEHNPQYHTLLGTQYLFFPCICLRCWGTRTAANSTL